LIVEHSQMPLAANVPISTARTINMTWRDRRR
jgi:hypothetical protein